MGKRNSCYPVTVEWLGHFRVSPSLCFTARLSAKQVIWKWFFYSYEDETRYHKIFALRCVLKVAVFETWKWPTEQWAHNELHCWVPVEQNNPCYLKDFLVNNCSFSTLITKHDNVLLQFTTARVITIYDNVSLQFTIAWLLQFSITVITIHDRTFHH